MRHGSRAMTAIPATQGSSTRQPPGGGCRFEPEDGRARNPVGAGAGGVSCVRTSEDLPAPTLRAVGALPHDHVTFGVAPGSVSITVCAISTIGTDRSWL